MVLCDSSDSVSTFSWLRLTSCWERDEQLSCLLLPLTSRSLYRERVVLRLLRRVLTDSIRSAVSLSTNLTSSIMLVVRESRWAFTLLMVPDTLVDELREEVTEEVEKVKEPNEEVS